MIEIRKIREYTIQGRPKKAEKAFDPAICVENIDDLFNEKLPSIIEKIPVEERYNCFYTLGHAPANKDPQGGRKWGHQDVIPFDIDDCEYKSGKPDPRYLEVIEEALGVDLNKIVVIATGNGLQVLVKPRSIISDARFFEKNSTFYSALCSKLVEGLDKRGLKGKPDVSAFQQNRLFRLPQTYNVKPGRPKRLASVLKGKLETVDFDLSKASGLPNVPENESVPDKELKYIRVDSASVESGCEFLKYVKKNQKTISEPEWYAALSILGRLENPEEKAHTYSKEHPNYTPEETIKKLKQSIGASGPRTCDNINTLWGKCRECPNYAKVNSPISIKSPDFIATRDTGFHTLNPKSGALSPCYNDLLLFYAQSHQFVNCNSVHYVWTGTHFHETSDVYLDNFAETHMHPILNHKVVEFRNKVKRTHIVDQNFFRQTTDRHINLQNGILNIDTLKLIPHSTSFGFRYTLPFAYDPIAQAPLFSKMLKDVTCHDFQLESILLEYMGYALSGDDPISQKFLLLTGEGANGKSTFVKILMALGGRAATSLTDTQLANQFDLVHLEDSLFNVIEEVPKFLNDSFWQRLKSLTTGTAVTASRKFKDSYQFICKTKFIMLSNNPLKGGDASDGFYRRFLIVPFNAKFNKESGNLDRHIDKKIIATELPGVLNMVLDAYHKLKDRDHEFSQADAVDKAVQEYIVATDNVAEWAEDCIQIDAESFAANEDLYTNYRSFVESVGEKPFSAKSMGMRLAAWARRRGVTLNSKLARKDGKVSRGILGVKITKKEMF